MWCCSVPHSIKNEFTHSTPPICKTSVCVCVCPLCRDRPASLCNTGTPCPQLQSSHSTVSFPSLSLSLFSFNTLVFGPVSLECPFLSATMQPSVRHGNEESTPTGRGSQKHPNESDAGHWAFSRSTSLDSGTGRAVWKGFACLLMWWGTQNETHLF